MSVSVDHVVAVNDAVEQFIRMMIRISEDPSFVMTGVHNAFAHGDIFEEIGMSVQDSDLSDLFEGLDKCNKAIDNISGNK